MNTKPYLRTGHNLLWIMASASGGLCSVQSDTFDPEICCSYTAVSNVSNVEVCMQKKGKCLPAAEVRKLFVVPLLSC